MGIKRKVSVKKKREKRWQLWSEEKRFIYQWLFSKIPKKNQLRLIGATKTRAFILPHIIEDSVDLWYGNPEKRIDNFIRKSKLKIGKYKKSWESHSRDLMELRRSI